MSLAEHINKLIKNHWLAAVLKPDELSNLLQKTTLVKYRKRETVIKRGEFATHLILVIDGYVKIEIDEGKKNFILDIIQGINFVGLPLVLSIDKYHFSIVSLTDAEVLFIPMDAVKKVIESNSTVAMSVIRYGNDSFVSPLLEKLQSASRNNIRGRLAKLILHFSSNTHRSNNFILLVSRFEIAQMIGFSRENVIRMLTEFNAEGIIKINGKSMEVIDFDRLEDLAKYS